jgi:hypothetical protein
MPFGAIMLFEFTDFFTRLPASNAGRSDENTIFVQHVEISF